ncbi:MAG TPA: chromosome segregation protein, partial [Novosphingobium sp.]|nr:chromosome segregation protein [Novosphingobium sp.]
RTALRAVDQAEALRERQAQRRADLARVEADLAAQRQQIETELASARAARAGLPGPDSIAAELASARAAHETARTALQSAIAGLAGQDQLLAAARERSLSQAAEIRSWQARAGDAARRLAQMQGRTEEIASERAVVAAKPERLAEALARAQGARAAMAQRLAETEATLAAQEAAARAADAALANAQEQLASAREARAASAARAEAEDARRAEAARLSGERFQCPPPLLAERFGFAGADVAGPEAEAAAHERLVAERDRLGPVNLVAAEELGEAETRAAQSLREREELAEAVNRLRGSIGNLNREGRERLRAAFEAVDGHFRRLFTTLFQGGQAHLALIDSDDPLEAGLEIFAQPPGKRLQSLTLASGGEQALTAVALIFALFLTNPSPICVLDEVDAPLDDANIERFCDLLEAMVRETDTRYLIVTHNAVTMSRMHRLFGVTMVEKGVSRLVSVDLGGG